MSRHGIRCRAAAILLLAWLGGCSSTPLQNTLIIGASHSKGAFGDALIKGLEAGGQTVYLYAGCGSQAQHWTAANNDELNFCGKALRKPDGTPRVDIVSSDRSPLQQLLQAHRPETVIVQLGDNMANAYRRVLDDEQVAAIGRQMSRVFEELRVFGIPSRRCFWVTPTWGEDGSGWHKSDDETRAVRDAIAAGIESAGYCRLIDSLSPGIVWSRAELDELRRGEEFTTDGLHLKPRYGREWGRRVSRYIARQ